MPDREEVMREAREYLDAREEAREVKLDEGALKMGLFVLVIGCILLVAAYFAEPPLRFVLGIAGMLIAVAAIPIAQLGTYGHGPYGIWPVKGPREADFFDAIVLGIGEKRFRIAVVIVVVIAVILLLLS